MNRGIAARSARLDERGVALPLAMMGLVVTALLFTAVLLSSSTEVALSGAQQDAAGSLYAAEAGIEAYAATLPPTSKLMPTQTPVVYTLPGSGQKVQITIAQLAAAGAQRYYSIMAQPLVNGRPRGRTVVAMLRQSDPTPPANFANNINSAVTLGGDLHVNGNAFTVSGRAVAGDTCASNGGVDAVEAAVNAKVDANNEKHMQNFLGANGKSGRAAIKTTNDQRADLVARVLGLEEGQTIRDFIEPIPLENKWGPMFNRPAFRGTVDTLQTGDRGLAVVDANGGTVSLKGGIGMLIVVNGNVELKGNVRFEGIILVEGNFTLSGTPDIVGALISLSQKQKGAGENVSMVDLDDNALGNGNVTVQYHQCNIKQAQRFFNQVSVKNMETSSTFAWAEVVR